MAFHTLIEVWNAFLLVLSTNLVRLVLMTAVTGVADVVIVYMAGYACCIVITIQQK